MLSIHSSRQAVLCIQPLTVLFNFLVSQRGVVPPPGSWPQSTKVPFLHHAHICVNSPFVKSLQLPSLRCPVSCCDHAWSTADPIWCPEGFLPVPAGPSQALGLWLVLKENKIFNNGNSEELSNKVQYDLPYDYLIPSLFPGSYTKKIFNCLQALHPHPAATFSSWLWPKWLLYKRASEFFDSSSFFRFFIFIHFPLHVILVTPVLLCTPPMSSSLPSSAGTQPSCHSLPARSRIFFLWVL